MVQIESSLLKQFQLNFLNQAHDCTVTCKWLLTAGRFSFFQSCWIIFPPQMSILIDYIWDASLWLPSKQKLPSLLSIDPFISCWESCHLVLALFATPHGSVSTPLVRCFGPLCTISLMHHSLFAVASSLVFHICVLAWIINLSPFMLYQRILMGSFSGNVWHACMPDAMWRNAH